VPVEVAVEGRQAHLMLLLDTGSTSTVLHRQSVRELPFQPGETVNATVAGGRKLKSEKVVTRYLDVGPFEMKNFPVMLISPQGTNIPFDGMLGMDFLKDHPHEIDYANEIIRWKPVNNP
jgi:predicted aspartyl protease